MPDTLFSIDQDHLAQIAALRPEAALWMGLTKHQDGFASPDADLAAVLQVLQAWQQQRAAASRDKIPPRERTLHGVDDEALKRRTAFTAFVTEHRPAHADPDVVGTPLLVLVEHALRAGDVPALDESWAARVAAFGPNLEAARAAVSSPDVYLTERARMVAERADGVLAFIKAQGRTDLDPVRAALAEAKAWLAGLSARDAHAQVKPAHIDELLRLRGLELTAEDVRGVAKDTIEQMRIEKVRIARRAFDKAAPAVALSTIRGQRPYTTEEAAAWMGELYTKSRAFVDERSLFEGAGPDARVLEGSAALRHTFGQNLLLPARSNELAKARLILSAYDENDLGALCVADLETLTAQLLEPGRARLAAATVAEGGAPLRHPDLVGAVDPWAGVFASEVPRGWAYHAEGLMREQGFRESPASRFIHAHHVEDLAIQAWYDIELASGRVDIDRAASGLTAHAAYAPPDARRMALELYRHPTRAVGALLGKIRFRQLRRGARAQWRHGFTDRRLHEMVSAAGAVPIGLLFTLYELFSPFNADEGTVEFSPDSAGAAN